MTEYPDKLFCFALDKHMFALPLKQVVRVIRAVAATEVPNASQLFYGVIDMHGEIIPVINLRHRFALPLKAISMTDRFVIVDAGHRKLALVADSVEGVRDMTDGDYQETLVPLIKESPAGDSEKVLAVSRFLRDQKGIIIIYQVEGLISNSGIGLLDALDALLEEGRP